MSIEVIALLIVWLCSIYPTYYFGKRVGRTERERELEKIVAEAIVKTIEDK